MAKLPVLMYHDVSSSKSDGLTISVSNLEDQLRWLSQNGYRSYHCSELSKLQKLPSRKSVLITFDDAYVNQFELAYPLLQKYQLKATIFVPLQFIGNTDQWNEGKYPIMNAAQLKSLNADVIELAHHSYGHINYATETLETVANDLEKSFQEIERLSLPIQPYLAYAYGKFPRDPTHKTAFFELLEQYGFQYAFRIGNKVSTFPFKQRFEIKRLDIKGEFSLSRFRRKLSFGQLF